MTDAKLSLIVNTAALDPRIGGRSNPHRRSRYMNREHLLRDEILPAVREQDWDEVLVVGQWEPGEGYEYIEMEPRYRDRRDALWQRDLGFRASTGDILTFCHDDHRPGDGYAEKLRNLIDDPSFPEWDILVPKRIHAETGEEMNNGHPKWSALDGRPMEFRKDGYMGGHCCTFRRWVPARIPWTTLDTEFWDTEMSRIWRQAGAEMVFAEDLVHLDLEAAADEQ